MAGGTSFMRKLRVASTPDFHFSASTVFVGYCFLENLLDEWSATLTQSRYVRAARYSLRIAGHKLI